ncbi:major facilitator superfamily domain-containing protein [Infundibulicybe gibba]|nr:major facilitator superfamily domain-containing protein [Infundibulicybe gibba]
MPFTPSDPKFRNYGHSPHPSTDSNKNFQDIPIDPEHQEIRVLITTNHEFPDGGLRAWTVVLGSFLTLFSTVNSYGVYQHYYQETMLKDTPASIISLIGGIQLFMLYSLSPIIGKVFDAHGLKYILPAGTFIFVLAIMMISLCEEGKVYQFFLAQGVLFGIGNALLFTPAYAVIGHWFKNRRAFAIGIVASGASVGGIVYPIILQDLIPRVGFPWAVRVTGFLTLACLLIACSTMRTRLPLQGKCSWKRVVDLNGFKDPRYCFSTIGAFFNFYGLYIPYFYIQTLADKHGLSHVLVSYLFVLINALGIPARVIPGLLGDRIGNLNTLIPTNFISAILCFAVWLPSRSAAMDVSFACLYGLFSGAMLGSFPAYISAITPVEVLGARLGSIYFVLAIATLIGTPSAGALVKIPDQKHFNSLIIFTGFLLLIGAFMFTFARVKHSRKLWAKV